MKKLLPLALFLAISFTGFSQTIVHNINAQYRHGQSFIKWDVIPSYSGFYYVYRFEHPITNNNIDSAKYLGRVPHDFSLNYFLDLGTKNCPHPETRYLVLNRNPLDSLDATKCCFVTTCSKQKTYFYAVTSDSAVIGGTTENRFIKPGANATTSGVAEKVEKIEAILQINDLPLIDDTTMLYDSYAVFGGNIKTQYTPEFANEGCLVYNFGLVPDDDPGNNNAACMFFYGGGGNAYENVNATKIDGMWKISMEDVIPNFSWDPVSGENTKWIGYNENVDVYNANDDTPPPTTGVDKTYTIARLRWTREWLLRTFPNDLDSTRISAHGSSNGCTGAMALSYTYPDWISACDVVNAKLNAEYLGDDNPSCKWNINGSSRHRAEIFLGTLSDNLPSDLPKIDGQGNYKMWDWANFDVLLKDNKYRSLPVMYLTSGKEDNVTCWDEKIPYYNYVNQNKTGGFYFWDQRAHKGGTHVIKDNPLENLLRYSTKLSYPAFSNCSLNDDPGDTNNPQPPYYDGDTIGSINGVLDWVDTSLHETPDSWQAIIFSHQFELNIDGYYYPYDGLPPYVKVDLTPRRLQQFVNIPNGSTICMENWEGNVLKQSRSITYHTNSKGQGLMTFKKVKVRQQSEGGNLIKIYKCGSPKLTAGATLPEKAGIDNVYPNPTAGATTIDVSVIHDSKVVITVKNILGEQLMKIDKGMMTEGEQQVPLDLSVLPAGMYVVSVEAGEQVSSYKVIKE